MQQAAQANAPELLRLAEAAGIGFYVARMSGRVTAANATFLDTFGWTPADLAAGAIDWQRMTPPDLRAACLALGGEALSTGRNYIRMEKAYLHADGTPIPVLVSCAFAPREDEAACFVLDLRERERLSDALVDSERRLAAARMASGCVHDFNNLLTVVLGEAELALGARDPATMRSRLQTIVTTVERAIGITGQVAGLSRQGGCPGVFDLGRLVEDARPLLTALLGRGVVLDLDLPAAPLPLAGEQARLTQILLNLASNARDAMAGRGRLAVAAACDAADGVAALTISDTGCGMAPELAARVFEPYVSTKAAGTGLGLWIVDRIVREWGGTVAIASAPGAGTTFRIRLPLAPAAWQAAEERHPAAATRSAER